MVMYQSKNAKLRNIFLTGAAVLVILTAGANAQDGMKLRDVVEEYGFGWMFGEWAATTEDGQKIQSYYKWELGGHLVSLGFQMGEFKGRGMIFYDPGEDQIVQIGVDSRGGTVKGAWDAYGDMAVAKLYYSAPDGQINKMGATHAKVDADTMKVEFYELDNDGELAEETTGTMEYKRQKKQPPKKADKKDKKKLDDASKKKVKYEPIPIKEIKVTF